MERLRGAFRHVASACAALNSETRKAAALRALAALEMDRLSFLAFAHAERAHSCVCQLLSTCTWAGAMPTYPAWSWDSGMLRRRENTGRAPGMKWYWEA